MAADSVGAGPGRRLTWPEAAAFFLAAWAACGAVPAAGFWLAWGDERLVRTALATGLLIAGLSLGVQVGTRWRPAGVRPAAGGSPPSA